MKIQVTEKHIQKGVPEHCTKCAISLALQDALEGYNLFDVEVTIKDYNHNTGEFKFVFREHLNEKDSQYTNYTISQTDERNINHFVNEFDTFGYDMVLQESIPCDDVVHAKPFTFELGGEIESQTVMSGGLK